MYEEKPGESHQNCESDSTIFPRSSSQSQKAIRTPENGRQKKESIRTAGIPYFLIGQTIAADRLVQKLLSHLLVPTSKPLVLIFAGPSGHGRLSWRDGWVFSSLWSSRCKLLRWLSSWVGEPTSLRAFLVVLATIKIQSKLIVMSAFKVDCIIVTGETDIFGPRDPYHGVRNGSPLNSFLARNAGQRPIVFLGEFEKTTPDVHKAMLLPFDNSRTPLQQIKHSKTDSTAQESTKTGAV